jgi:hypothetical protein
MKATPGDDRACGPRPAGRNGLPAPDKVVLVELLGSGGFPVTRHVYGQTFLKIDLLTEMPRTVHGRSARDRRVLVRHR